MLLCASIYQKQRMGHSKIFAYTLNNIKSRVFLHMKCPSHSPAPRNPKNNLGFSRKQQWRCEHRGELPNKSQAAAHSNTLQALDAALAERQHLGSQKPGCFGVSMHWYDKSPHGHEYRVLVSPSAPAEEPLLFHIKQDENTNQVKDGKHKTNFSKWL